MQLQFPTPQFKTRTVGGKTFIHCTLRRRWLVLTPEEWVRQNMAAYLLQVLGYPKALMAAEKGIVVAGLKKRFDLLVFDQQHQPWLLVECKGDDVPLTEEVLHQALRYNMAVPAAYIIITNGVQTLGWKRSGSGLESMSTLPPWPV